MPPQKVQNNRTLILFSVTYKLHVLQLLFDHVLQTFELSV